MAIYFYEKDKPYYEFSNFYSSPITIEGKLYPTVEHFYQSSKFLGPDASQESLEYAELIRQTNTPTKAFKMGRQKKSSGYASKWRLTPNSNTPLLNELINQYKNIPVRPDWEDPIFMKDQIMFQGLNAKFNQNPKLKEILLSTEDKKLVEHTHRDKYWADAGDGSGLNKLGKLLMKLRNEFQK